MAVSAWEALFMLVVLKIPMAYLAAVVWWAIRAEPTIEGGDEPLPTRAPLAPCGWEGWRRRRPASRFDRRPPVGPRGGYGRASRRVARARHVAQGAR